MWTHLAWQQIYVCERLRTFANVLRILHLNITHPFTLVLFSTKVHYFNRAEFLYRIPQMNRFYIIFSSTSIRSLCSLVSDTVAAYFPSWFRISHTVSEIQYLRVKELLNFYGPIINGHRVFIILPYTIITSGAGPGYNMHEEVL